MDKPAEILLFDFFEEQIGAAVPAEILYEVELHDTIHQKIKTPRGIRISEAVGDLSPGPENVLKEYDVLIILTCYSRVIGPQKTQRQPALIDVFNLQKESYRVLLENPTLNERVCDLLLLKGSRGYDVFDEGVYAVSNTPIIINPSGERFDENRSYV